MPETSVPQMKKLDIGESDSRFAAAVTCARQALMVCGAWRWYGSTVFVRATDADGVALGGVRAPEGRAVGPRDATIKDAVSGAE